MQKYAAEEQAHTEQGNETGVYLGRNGEVKRRHHMMLPLELSARLMAYSSQMNYTVSKTIEKAIELYLKGKA